MEQKCEKFKFEAGFSGTLLTVEVVDNKSRFEFVTVSCKFKSENVQYILYIHTYNHREVSQVLSL